MRRFVPEVTGFIFHALLAYLKQSRVACTCGQFSPPGGYGFYSLIGQPSLPSRRCFQSEVSLHVDSARFSETTLVI